MGKAQQLADHDHPLVRETAERLVRGENTVRGKLERLFYYVRDDVKFGFPRDGDLVKASDTIKLGMGQCNNKGVLLLALCQTAGIPARIHFAPIRKEIQRGLFTGLFYDRMPDMLSHSWIEVEIDEKWRRIDSYINDEPYYRAARLELEKKGWDTGYSVSCPGGECSAEFNIDTETFVQMEAVVGDHGVWDDPADYFATDKYQNRPSAIKLLFYRLMIGRVNKRVEQMRASYPAAIQSRKEKMQ